MKHQLERLLCDGASSSVSERVGEVVPLALVMLMILSAVAVCLSLFGLVRIRRDDGAEDEA